MASPTSLPMFGAFVARVLGCSPVSLHGDQYFDTVVQFAPDQGPMPPRNPVTVRLARHQCARPPATGDHLELTFLMGQVDQVLFVDRAC